MNGTRRCSGLVLASLLSLVAGCHPEAKNTASLPVQASQVALNGPTHYRSLILNYAAVGYWWLGDSPSAVAGQKALAKDETPAGVSGTYVGTYDDTAGPTLNQPGAILGDTDGSAFFYIPTTTITARRRRPIT